MSARAPRLILGNMTFGWSQSSSFVDSNIAEAMLSAFMASGGRSLDTARIYAGGTSEAMTGEILSRSPQYRSLELATKAHPSAPGGLSPEGLRGQIIASLSALQSKSVGVLYLHQPDTACPLVDTLKAAKILYDEGFFKELGLSNYSAAEVERAVEICVDIGCAPPTVYQGLYNPINRRVEIELMPTLRKHSIKFIAYNPLAAGMLTGKHVQSGDVLEGRFKENPNYLNRFYKDDVFKGLELIRAACDAEGTSMTHATFSWLLHHSELGESDGVLLGASKLEHLEKNLECAKVAKPLSENIRVAFDKAWELTQADAFAFWRGYSQDHPNASELDQGAAYTVKK